MNEIIDKMILAKEKDLMTEYDVMVEDLRHGIHK